MPAQEGGQLAQLASVDPPAPALAALAFPFLPADEARPAAVLEADRRWSFDSAAVPSGADVVVWGRLPEPSGSARTLVRAAAAREMALRALQRRLPDGLSVAAVHRLGPRGLGGGPRGTVRSLLRSGALVELRSPANTTRVLDAVADAAGVGELEGKVYAGSGGAVLVRGRRADGGAVLLRVGRAGEQGDPAAVGDELERLAEGGVPLAPRLVGRGTVAGASWVAEGALPGGRPSRLTASVARQVAQACARFPRIAGPPVALADDLLSAAHRLPERSDALRHLAADMDAMVAELPAVLRHGDLWSGNLLVDRGTLTGMIDWDALHPSGVPGADLVQLLGVEARRRARHSLGQGFLARPWRSRSFRELTADYWDAVGVAPVDTVLDAAGMAWWATEVHHTLARLPHRATDEHWIATNVDAVLAGLGY